MSIRPTSVITTIQADYASKKDSQCLPSLLANTKDNLKAAGLHIKEALADAAYSSSEALRALKEQHITGYIPNFGQYKPARAGFKYYPGGDYYKCSQKAKLPFKKLVSSHDGAYQMKEYRSSSLDCRHCPLRSTCIGKSDFKKIVDTVDKYLYNEMHQRMQTPRGGKDEKAQAGHRGTGHWYADQLLGHATGEHPGYPAGQQMPARGSGVLQPQKTAEMDG